MQGVEQLFRIAPLLRPRKPAGQAGHVVRLQTRAGLGFVEVGAVAGVLKLQRLLVMGAQPEDAARGAVKVFAVGPQRCGLEPGAEHRLVLRAQLGGGAPLGQRLLKLHGLGQALGVGHMGVKTVVGHGNLRRGHFQGAAAYQHHQGHQRSPCEKATQVGHVGHASAAEPVLQQLVRNPRGQ